MAEVTDDAIYLAAALRNVGSGIAVLHGWYIASGAAAAVAIGSRAARGVPPADARPLHRARRGRVLAGRLPRSIRSGVRGGAHGDRGAPADRRRDPLRRSRARQARDQPTSRSRRVTTAAGSSPLRATGTSTAPHRASNSVPGTRVPGTLVQRAVCALPELLRCFQHALEARPCTPAWPPGSARAPPANRHRRASDDSGRDRGRPRRRTAWRARSRAR